MQVSERESIFISKVLTASGKFTQYINLGFIPDEVRVVQIIYAPTAANDRANLLSWDGVGNVGFFDNNAASANVNIRINTHGKMMQGLQSFTVLAEDGEVATDHNGGSLGVVMEAIKYQ